MRHINDYLLITHTPNGRQFPRLDCWGLIVDYYRENLGIILSDYTSLDAKTMSKGLQYERQAGRFQEVQSPENNDIIAFFISGRLYHVGIYLNGRILHTSERKNARLEKLDATTLSHRRFYRYVKN